VAARRRRLTNQYTGRLPAPAPSVARVPLAEFSAVQAFFISGTSSRVSHTLRCAVSSALNEMDTLTAESEERKKASGASACARGWSVYGVFINTSDACSYTRSLTADGTDPRGPRTLPAAAPAAPLSFVVCWAKFDHARAPSFCILRSHTFAFIQ
jgi:hypothetical protein